MAGTMSGFSRSWPDAGTAVAASAPVAITAVAAAPRSLAIFMLLPRWLRAAPHRPRSGTPPGERPRSGRYGAIRAPGEWVYAFTADESPAPAGLKCPVSPGRTGP